MGTLEPRRRPRDYADDDDAKWNFTPHTEAKHEILRRYLGAWLSILGRGRDDYQPKRLYLVDGFAGRGRYNGGEPGSPRIMFDRAAQIVDDGLAKSVVIRCAEPSATNFAHLQAVCNELKHDHVTINPTQETFVQMGQRLAGWAESQTAPTPIFVFIDPFGSKGVPLTLIRRLMRIKRLEVLLTFMVRDPSRFLREENWDTPLTELFGGDSWRACSETANRPECLMVSFRDVLRGDVCDYVLSFKVHEDAKKKILYYLVHMTNSDVGMREMKRAMVNKSGDMTFFPVTMRPPNQLRLEVDEAKPYPSLQKRLAQFYAGRQMSFIDLLNRDYPDDHSWLEPAYKAALTAMEKRDPPAATVERLTKTRTGRERRRIEPVDLLRFP